jgi:hypothetical protein
VGLHWIEQIAGGVAAWKTRTAAWAGRYGIWVLVTAAMLWPIVYLAPRAWSALRVLRRVRLVRRGHARADDATLLYCRMLDLMKKRGYQKPAWFTPQEFAASLPHGESGRLVTQFTDAYNALRYGRRVEAATRLSSLLQQLEQVR